MMGITSANHEIILLTDADCLPVSDFWIQEMTARFRQNTEFVLGYSQYIKGKGLLNMFYTL